MRKDGRLNSRREMETDERRAERLGSDEPDVSRIDLDCDPFFRLSSVAPVLWKQD